MEALSYARLGMTQALARFDRASDQLLRAVSGDEKVEPIAAISEQMQSRAQFSASLLSAKIADAMMQDLIDIQSKR